MTRLLLAAIVLLGITTTVLALRGDARADSQEPIIMRIGDTMQVEGAGIGCQIGERDGLPRIDCRRAGKLAGTYMTLFDKRRVEVARFRNRNTARVVYTAKHDGRDKRCDDDAKRAGRH